ncbi:helix-turn-helix domain-containing protein [Enterococcus pingfangensis]|uniref:helix-turn-helix domain-containing protein n=1 Tax=Enterococcus pingfangensis TaxID=2559924 RepID=UPI0010F5D053|nr:helix-turn-helix domain-containing protein [Enterococcus pingfangensis]
MLTKEIYGQLQLLMLLEQKDDWCSGIELARASGLNVNTVQKYLDHLQELIKDFSDVSLEKHRNYGARFNRKADFPMQRLFSEVICQSILTSFFEELLLQGEIDIRTFCDEHFVSTSTLRRNIRKLEKKLAPLGLYLTKGTIIRVIGPEHQIRYLFYQYLWTIYRGVKELPWEIERQMFYPIEQLSTLFDFEFTNVQRSQLGVLLFVFQCRTKIEPSYEGSLKPAFEAPSLFSHWQKDDWGMLLFFLQLLPLFFDLGKERSLVILPENIQNILAKQSTVWLELFEETFNVSIEDKKSISDQLNQLFLFNHYLNEVYTLTGLFPIVDEERLKKSAPGYMENFSAFSKKLFAEIGTHNPKVTELCSLLMANTIVSYLSYRPTIKVFILSDLGKAFEAMQKDLLIAGLGNDYQIEFVHSEEAADLTLSNLPTHYGESLQIRSTIDARDLRMIRQLLKKRNS